MARPPGDPLKRMHSMTMAITQNQRKLLARLQKELNAERKEKEASLSAVIRGCIRHTLKSLEVGTIEREDLDLS